MVIFSVLREITLVHLAEIELHNESLIDIYFKLLLWIPLKDVYFQLHELNHMLISE